MYGSVDNIVLYAVPGTMSAFGFSYKAFFITVVLAMAFTRYTLRPPAEPDRFVDPLNKRYGLEAHPDNERQHVFAAMIIWLP